MHRLGLLAVPVAAREDAGRTQSEPRRTDSVALRAPYMGRFWGQDALGPCQRIILRRGQSKMLSTPENNS